MEARTASAIIVPAIRGAPRRSWWAWCVWWPWRAASIAARRAAAPRAIVRNPDSERVGALIEAAARENGANGGAGVGRGPEGAARREAG